MIVQNPSVTAYGQLFQSSSDFSKKTVEATVPSADEKSLRKSNQSLRQTNERLVDENQTLAERNQELQKQNFNLNQQIQEVSDENQGLSREISSSEQTRPEATISSSEFSAQNSTSSQVATSAPSNGPIGTYSQGAEPQFFDVDGNNVNTFA